LNCYAKLKDVDKLEKFIKSPGHLKFDLEVAISMCRQGGYYRQAVYLATKHEEHGLVITILVEDSKDYGDALEYMWRLEPDLVSLTTFWFSAGREFAEFWGAQVRRNLMKYATVLLEHCPEDTTQLFIDFYTGAYAPKSKTAAEDDAATSQSPQGVGATAIQTLAAFFPLPYATSSPSVISPPAAQGQNATASQALSRGVEGANVQQQLPPPVPTYEVPRPRTAFSSFVDHPNHFVRFLEACLGHGELNEQDRADVVTTLFEMYVHFAQEKKYDQQDEWAAKAKRLIDGGNVASHTPCFFFFSVSFPNFFFLDSFFFGMCWTLKSSLLARRCRLTPRTSCFSRTCRTFAMARRLCGRSRGFVSISSAPIRPLTTLPAQSGR
jgi:hypothetical protein